MADVTSTNPDSMAYTLTAISRLPDELLEDIWLTVLVLQLCHTSCMTIPTPGSPIGTTMKHRPHASCFRSSKPYWSLTVSHVCRYWRAVALACNRLWADITFRDPLIVHEMLQRSGSAPLTIRTCWFTNIGPTSLGLQTTEDLFELVAQHTPRMRRLYLDLSPNILRALQLYRDDQWDTSALQTLVVWCPLGHINYNRIPAFIHAPLPELRTLHVTGSSLAFVQSLARSTVIDLRLVWVSFTPTALTTLLKVLPTLRHLTLDDPRMEDFVCLPNPSAAAIAEPRQLRTLAMSCFYTGLLEYIIPPPSCPITITCDAVYYNMRPCNHWTSVLDHVRNKLIRSGSHLTSYGFYCSDLDPDEIKLYMRKCHYYLALWTQAVPPQPLSFNCAIHNVESPETRPAFVFGPFALRRGDSDTVLNTKILPALPLRNVTSVFMSPKHYPVTISEWFSIHSASPSIRSVSCYQNATAKALLDAILYPFRRNARPELEKVMFPLLEELVLCNVNWQGESLKARSTLSHRFGRHLLEMLETRQQAGLGLRKIIIQDPICLQPEMVDQLRALLAVDVI